MMQSLNLWAVPVGDWVFGWILYLPRDVALFGVAIMASALLTVARRWTTNQEWLQRAAADTQRQNQLKQEALARGEKEAALRHQDVTLRIKLNTLRQEWKPLLWVLIPVTLLATWSFARLAYLPPKINQPVEIHACLPRAGIGQLAHLVPEPGVAVVGDWIQPVVADQRVVSHTAWGATGPWMLDRVHRFWHWNDPGTAPAPVLDGVAVWHVILQDAKLRRLKIRYDGHTYEAPIRAGTPVYEEPVTDFPGAPLQAIEVVLVPRRLFNLVGGVDWLFLPPWLVAYFLIASPAVSILKRAFKIY